MGGEFKKFCHQTHLHGFEEMANAKNYPCKIFWFALTLFSIGITAATIFYAAASFFSKSTDISLVHKKIDDMFYPPLRVCVPHWMGWVNFTAAKEMNFTKHEVQFAMSYLTEIYTTSKTFDIDEIEVSFYTKLRLNGIPTIGQFYKSIAYQKPNVLNMLKEGSSSVPKYNIVFGDFWGYVKPRVPSCQLCYQFSVQPADFENDIIVRLKLSDVVGTKDEILSWLTETEYVAQIDGDVLLYRANHQLNQLLPLRVYPDGYSRKVLHIIDGSQKVGVMDIKVLNKVSSASAPCRSDHRWIKSDSTCLKKCETYREIDTYENRAIYLVRNTTERIPYEQVKDVKEIFKTYDEREIQRKDNMEDNSAIVELLEQFYGQPDDPQYELCVKDCKKEVGCESWSYSYRPAQVQTAMNTENLVIIYPSSVTATEEVFVQTWQNFTSNLGGLLGIFMGASFVTICQLFQFCYSLFHKNQVAVVEMQPM